MQKIKIVGILQNAWSTYWTEDWPRHHWLEALKRSPTGRRLKLLENERLDIWYDETTPKVADNPRTILPADLNYMRKFLNKQQPTIIVTFGKPAAEAMEKLIPEFKQPVMFLPHPTYRIVTNDLFIAAREHLVKGYIGYYRYVQERGNHLVKQHPIVNTFL